MNKEERVGDFEKEISNNKCSTVLALAILH